VLVGLGNQQAVQMRRIVICGLSGSTDISTLSHKQQDFGKKKVTEPKTCILISSTVFLKISQSSKHEPDMILNVC
jgi:hypothetical protein